MSKLLVKPPVTSTQAPAQAQTQAQAPAQEPTTVTPKPPEPLEGENVVNDGAGLQVSPEEATEYAYRLAQTKLAVHARTAQELATNLRAATDSVIEYAKRLASNTRDPLVVHQLKAKYTEVHAAEAALSKLIEELSTTIGNASKPES